MKVIRRMPLRAHRHEAEVDPATVRVWSLQLPARS
jgi:hypothetical protein